MAMNAILASVSLGLLSATSPCILLLYPGFLVYLSGMQETTGYLRGRYFLGFFVMAGVVTMMLALAPLPCLARVPWWWVSLPCR
jgi:cytochrome c-type biogenesis protein